MISSKKILASAVVSGVMALGSVTAQAGAVAQSILEITNFRIGATNVDAATQFAGANSGDVSAQLGNVSASDTANPEDFSNFTLSECVGAGCGNYSPGTALAVGSDPLFTYAGSASSVSGDALTADGSTALIDNTVSMTGSNVGTSGSNVGLLASFTITTDEVSSLIFGFNADAFLRTFVGTEGVGSAIASINWNLSVSDDDDEVFSWNGGNDIEGGVLINSACAINRTRSRNTPGENSYDPSCDSTADVFQDGGAYGFGAITGELAAGTYQVSIRQSGSADARFQAVPAPGTVALLGAGLLAVTGLRRRQRRHA